MAKTKYRIKWEGTQFVYHSLALVNREICLKLIESGCEVFIKPYEKHTFNGSADRRFGKIVDRILKMKDPVPFVDAHIRHQWPPNLEPPEHGRWITMQPWEFGSVPAEWVTVFKNQIDELWVPSRYVKKAFAEGGVPGKKIHVIPNGVNPFKFHPNVKPMALETNKSFQFLFVGGAIYRKGIDLLLKAYIEAFTPDDDVCLVIKNFGGNTFYKNQTLSIIIKKLSQRKDLPDILLLDETIPEDNMPGLYSAANVLVHPYRGEGFGLPILEAMACGIPTIVTKGGACLDYCNHRNSILVNASTIEHRQDTINGLKTVDRLWFHEIDMKDLKAKMTYAYKRDIDLKRIGAQAAEDVSLYWTWDKTVAKINERLCEVC